MFIHTANVISQVLLNKNIIHLFFLVKGIVVIALIAATCGILFVLIYTCCCCCCCGQCKKNKDFNVHIHGFQSKFKKIENDDDDDDSDGL